MNKNNNIVPECPDRNVGIIFSITPNTLTLSCGDEGERVAVLFDKALDDVNLVESGPHAVLVVGCAARVGRPELRENYIL